MNLSPNQVQFFSITGCLLGIWIVLCLVVLLGFDLTFGFSLLLGGLLHSLASLAQGSYYFSYRGAAAAGKMLAALGWGAAIKFAIIIAGSALLLYYVDQIHPVGFISGVILMHLLHSIANALFMR